MTKNQIKIINSNSWMPFGFDSTSGTIRWCRIEGVRFTDSFFTETLQKIKYTRTEIIETPVEILMKLKFSSLKPAGFIFHVSRCGSTLIAQLFSELPQCRVLSEPPIMDEFLFWLNSNSSLSDNEKKNLLANLIRALGRVNLEEEKYLIIKLDCWNIEYYHFIKQIFPEVPSVFVYREPLAVIKSHLRLRGLQMIPGTIKSILLDIELNMHTVADFNLYTVKVLEKIFLAAIEQQYTDKKLLINYNQLPSVIWSELLKYFGISFKDDDIKRMVERSKFDAKNAVAAFNYDQQITEVPYEIKNAVSINLSGYYDILERFRLGSPAS